MYLKQIYSTLWLFYLYLHSTGYNDLCNECQDNSSECFMILSSAKQVCYIATQIGCNGNPSTHLHKQKHKLVNEFNYWLGLQPQPLIYYTSQLEKYFHQICSILIRSNKLLCRRIILYLLKILLIKPSWCHTGS